MVQIVCLKNSLCQQFKIKKENNNEKVKTNSNFIGSDC